MIRALKTWIFRRYLDIRYPGVFDWRPLSPEDERRLRELGKRFGWKSE